MTMSSPRSRSTKYPNANHRRKDNPCYGRQHGPRKELARQLALREDFDRIYLGCRNPARLNAPRRTWNGHRDASLRGRDHRPLRHCVGESRRGCDRRSAQRPRDERRRHRRPTPASLTEDGVTEVFAQNLLGHVVLLEELIAAGISRRSLCWSAAKPRAGCRSCGSRDRCFRSSADEFASVIDGSFFAGGNSTRCSPTARSSTSGRCGWAHGPHAPRAQVRHDVAGKHGGNRGAARPAGACPHHRQPHLLPYLAPALGIGHKLDIGAERLSTP